MKLVKAETLEEKGKYLRVCDFGEPGSGKTWFGASAALDPETAPVLFLDYRSQIVSVRSNPKFLEALQDGRLVIVTLEKYSELNHIYTYLFRGPGKIPELDGLFEKHGLPKTLVVDSITELQRDEVMLKAGNTAGKFLASVEAPEIKHWGQLLNQFTLLAHLFYDLPLHVIFSGLEAVDFGRHAIGESPPVIGYRLAMQGQGQRQFPAYALTVMRLDRAPSNSNAFNIGYTQSVRAKTKEQTGFIPAKIADPTVPKLARLLRNKGKKESK